MTIKNEKEVLVKTMDTPHPLSENNLKIGFQFFEEKNSFATRAIVKEPDIILIPVFFFVCYFKMIINTYQKAIFVRV